MPDMIEKIADGFGKCVDVVAGATAAAANKAAYGLEWVALKCDPHAKQEIENAVGIIDEVAKDAAQVEADASKLDKSAEPAKP